MISLCVQWYGLPDEGLEDALYDSSIRSLTSRPFHGSKSARPGVGRDRGPWGNVTGGDGPIFCHLELEQCLARAGNGARPYRDFPDIGAGTLGLHGFQYLLGAIKIHHCALLLR